MIKINIILGFFVFMSMNTFSQSEREYNYKEDMDSIIHLVQLQLKESKDRVSLLQKYGLQLEDSLANCLNPSNPDNVREIDGKFYALLIVVQEYTQENFSDLAPEPMNDAESLKEVLEDDYNFEVEIIEDPGRKALMMKLQGYQTLTPNDNLLIFYAGHGGYDKTYEDGYWCPSDATEAYDTKVQNSDIRNLIKSIKSRNTLLIVDACWGGTINRSTPPTSVWAPNNSDHMEKVRHYYNKTSRMYMTSGFESTVPNKSVFLKNLVSELKKNKDKYLFSKTLFSRFSDRVIFNTPKSKEGVVEPKHGILYNVDHDAGDFIFIKVNEDESK